MAIQFNGAPPSNGTSLDPTFRPSTSTLLYGPTGAPLPPAPPTTTSLGVSADEDEDELYIPPQMLQPAAELPVYGVPPPDRTWQIEAILQQLENGQFQGAALLADAMRRDDRIVTAIEQRQSAVFGAPRQFKSATKPEAPAAFGEEQSDAVVEALDECWDYMLPRSALEEWEYHATFLGVGVMEMRWETDEKPWSFCAKVWHPQYLNWRWDLGAYTLITADRGLVRLPRPGERSTQWALYTPYGFERAFLYGRLRALVIPWLLGNWTVDDWGSFLEIHGHPIRQAIVPQNASPREEDNYVRSIANMASNTTIKSKQDKDGNKFDLKIIEAMSSGECFEKAKDNCDKRIAGVLIGQAMSIDGVSGLGSQEKAGAPVRLDIAQAISEKMGAALQTGPLREWVEVNFGETAKAPGVRWSVEPPEDLASRADVNLKQAQADQINIDSGVYSPEEARARYGKGAFTLDTEVDLSITAETLRAQRAEEKAAAAPAFGPNGEDPNAQDASSDPSSDSAPAFGDKAKAKPTDTKKEGDKSAD